MDRMVADVGVGKKSTDPIRPESTPFEEARNMASRFYRSFEEFAREEIRPMNRAGWSVDELDIDSDLATEGFMFDDQDSGDDDDE